MLDPRAGCDRLGGWTSSKPLMGPIHPELRLSSRPIDRELEGEATTACPVQDIAGEEHRELLERLFYHDLMNTVGGLLSLLELCSLLPPDQTEELLGAARFTVAQLIEEITTQRELMAAERAKREVTCRPVAIRELLLDLCSFYRTARCCEGKRLELHDCVGPHEVWTSEVLLRRVVGNLIKNALEASRSGEAVTISYQEVGHPVIAVSNEGVMPEDVRRGVFRRAFSTKGEAGRGLGTSSVKLIAETYLKGTVDFFSTRESGTTFILALPDRSRPLETRGDTSPGDGVRGTRSEDGSPGARASHSPVGDSCGGVGSMSSDVEHVGNSPSLGPRPALSGPTPSRPWHPRPRTSSRTWRSARAQVIPPPFYFVPNTAGRVGPPGEGSAYHRRETHEQA